MAIGWMLQNEGQEIPETASSGYKPVEPHRNAGGHIMLPGHLRGILPTVAVL